jgi:hypothetical protein
LRLKVGAAKLELGNSKVLALVGEHNQGRWLHFQYLLAELVASAGYKSPALLPFEAFK